MATLTERLQFVATLDAKGAIAGFNSIGKAADANMKNVDGKLDKLGGGLVKFGAGAVAVAGVAGAALFKAGQSASNLGESINAVNVTFGDAAQGILKLGENSAKSVGLSNSAFNSLAVQFSAFAETIVGESGDVVGAIDDITTRAADFASVMNIDVAEAARLFQSGLAGETEPLRKFGIDLSAAAVEAHAYAEGIAATGEELTEAEKVQSRYSLLMQQTAKAQGDFANTADSAANAQRVAAAEMENAMASLGASIAPIIATVAGKLGDLAGAFTQLNEATNGFVGKGVGIGVVLLGAAGAMSLVAGQAIKMRASLATAGTSFRNMGAFGKTAAIAMGVATVAMVGLAGQAQRTAQRNADLAESMIELGRVADEELSAAFGRFILDGFAKVIFNGGKVETVFRDLAAASLDGAKRALEYAKANGQSQQVIDGLTEAIRLETIAQKEATARTKEKTEADEAAATAAEDHAAAEDELQAVLGRVDELAQAAAESAADFAEEQEEAAEAADDLRDALADTVDNARDLKEAFDDLTGTQMSLESATRAVWDGMRDLKATVDEATESEDKYATSLNVATETGSKNRSMVQNQVQALIDHANAALADGQSIEEVTGHLQFNRQALIDNMDQMGFNRAEAEAYIDQLGLTPENITTAIILEGDHAAKVQLAEIIASLGQIDGEFTAMIQAHIDAGQLNSAMQLARTLERLRSLGVTNWRQGANIGSAGQAFAPFLPPEGAGATGAIVNRPTLALIGEDGPEALVPLNKTAGNGPLPSGLGGGDVYNITINTQADPRQVIQAIKQYTKNGGRL